MSSKAISIMLLTLQLYFYSSTVAVKLLARQGGRAYPPLEFDEEK